MSENSEPLSSVENNESQSLVRRLRWFMVGSVSVAIVVSLFFADWSFTTGLAIGGILSLINFNWLQASVNGLFKLALEGNAPKFPVFKYVLRFVIIGIIVGLAKWFEISSVIGILLGLCSLVAALMIEAIIQLYLHFSNSEEL
jgi:hypothetical protein